MAEENNQPVQEAPAEETPVQEAPQQAAPAPEIPRAAPAAAPKAPRKKGSALLVFLTVLLILVGIADLILWSVAGYYFLRNAQSENAGEPAETVSVVGEPANT